MPQAKVAAPKSGVTLFPVLVALFLVSYGLMTMLIVEQGKTIDIQRMLIGDLFTDSSKLSALKAHMAQQQAKARQQAQAPSAQVAPPSGKTSKKHRVAPLRPPKDTSDVSDARRSLITI